MTEKEKMQKGMLYCYLDKELAGEHARAVKLCDKYNRTPRKKAKKRDRILRELLGGLGENAYIENNFRCDYGYNIFAGDGFFVNYDCVFLDCAPIRFGDHVFIAPQCGFYTVNHPMDEASRAAYLEYARPITVGNHVWIGGGVKVMPGVTIGDNVVIGGGSVVVKDIPSDCVAVGNPARVVRKLGGALSEAKGKAKDADKAQI